MKENLSKCLTELWGAEGGYVDNPRDPGGATKYGITIGTLRDWRGKAVTKADVKALTRAEAEAIYRAWYWQPVRGDDLPGGLDAVAFDGAVNSGPSRSAKWLQSALGVAADGKIGPQTVAAARKANVLTIIDKALDARLHFMQHEAKDAKGKPAWLTFGDGWKARIKNLRAFAKGLASSARPAPKPTAPAIPGPADPPPVTGDVSTIHPLAVIGGFVAVLAAAAYFLG